MAMSTRISFLKFLAEKNEISANEILAYEKDNMFDVSDLALDLISERILQSNLAYECGSHHTYTINKEKLKFILCNLEKAF